MISNWRDMGVLEFDEDFTQTSGFLGGFSTRYHTHNISRIIEEEVTDFPNLYIMK